MGGIVRTWVERCLRGGVVLAFLFGGVARTASPADCSGIDLGPYKSGCGSVGLSSSRVRPGDKLTVSVSYGTGICNASAVSCSYALPDVVIDGQPAKAGGGFPPMYHYDPPRPAPAAGVVVSLPGGTSHTIEFTIDPRAPDACLELAADGSTIRGPFVVLGSGSTWSTPVAFEIDRKAGRDVSVSISAQTRKPDEVLPGEKFTYSITATADQTAKRLKIASPVPSGVVLVGAPSDGGRVQKGDVVWDFSDVAEKTVTYEVQVRDAKRLKKIKQIAASGRASAKFEKGSASDESRIFTKVAKPTTVRGTIRDVKLDFPKKTFVDENDAYRGAKIELRNTQGDVVDSTTSDGGGRYEVEADDAGTFTLHVEGRADRYDTGSNSIDPLLTVVQERTVEIADLTDPPKTEDVWLPAGLLAHASRSLSSVNNLKYNFAGFVPHTFRMDTTGIETEIQLLAEAKNQRYRPASEAHEPNGWDALVRLSACLDSVGRRYVDMAIAVDDLAKIIPVAILIQLMQKEGGNFSSKYAGVKSEFAPATAGSRLTEAAKITTLAYLVGNYLPPLLDRLGLPPTQKALVLELTYKLVRFGLNLFVPGMNTGDLAFEVILQAARTAIFEGGMIAARIYMQEEVDHAYTLFAQKQVAGTHADALAALSLFDDRVFDRSKQLHRITLDALFSISAIVRGTDGILFKVQQSIGLDADAGRFGKTLSKGIRPLGKALGFLKSKLFIPYFVTAGACAGGTVALTPFDIRSEITYAFQGFPPDARPLDLHAVNDVVDDWIGDWVRKYDPFYKPKRKPGETVPDTTLPEFRAALDRLAAIAVQVRAKQPRDYTDAVDATAQDFAALGDALVPLMEECASVPWDDEPRFVGCVVQGSQAVLAISQALLYADAWSIEPSAALARSALDAISDAAGDVNEAGLAAEAALGALSGRSRGPRLYVSARGFADARPASDVNVQITVRNAGDAPVSGGSADLETTAGLTLVSDASMDFGPLAPGESVVLNWTVHTADAGPTLVAFSAFVTSPDAQTVGLDETFAVRPPQ